MRNHEEFSFRTLQMGSPCVGEAYSIGGSCSWSTGRPGRGGGSSLQLYSPSTLLRAGIYFKRRGVAEDGFPLVSASVEETLFP